ncbi:MAG TPA: hypothetical protein VJT73_16200 [Polyangiaceae bacterium]|nr:hypothetical protein [Polyangiaceae bacterium]
MTTTASGALAIVMTESQGDRIRLIMTTYGADGAPSLEPIVVSAGSTAMKTSHPVVAAGGGKYAVAYTDRGADGDELGVALRLVDPASPPSDPPAHANTTTDFSQYDPDIIAIPSGFVVAWVDDANFATAPDIHVRTFGFDLMPTSPEVALAKTSATEADVALAPFGSGWAAAWRVAGASGESVLVRSVATDWTVGPFPPGPSGDRPALVELDDEHLLVVFTSGSSVASSFHLRAAVLDTRAPGAAAAIDVAPLVPETTNLAQSQPSAVHVNGALYVAWRTKGGLGDANHDELWMKRVLAGATPGTLDLSSPEFPLPRSADHRAGSQQRPALAGRGSQMVAVFEDLGGSFELAGKLGVVVQAIPVPVVRLIQSSVDAGGD